MFNSLLPIISTKNMTMKKNISSNSITNIKTNCKELTVYGELNSSVGLRLNRAARTMTVLPLSVIDQIVGHLLGDRGLSYSSTSITPYFYFTQTIKRFAYGFFVFSNFSFMCESMPVTMRNFRKGIHNYALRIRTRNYPNLIIIHELFYKNIGENKFIKYISEDLINYLNPRVLAYLYMDDGSYALSGFYLHTEGFTKLDVYRLAGMLHYQFGLKVTVQWHEGKPMVYISAKSKQLFISLIEKYIHPSMLYKIGK